MCVKPFLGIIVYKSQTVSRYIEMEATEIADDGSYTDVDIMLRLVRLADHPRKKKPDDNPNVARVKFKINKLIVVRSAEGTIYEWSSLPWKPQKVDLMNGRNTLAPKAGHGGKMIVKPTFFIRPNDMQAIKKDARKRIPEAIYKSAKELAHKKWDEEEHGYSSSQSASDAGNLVANLPFRIRLCDLHQLVFRFRISNEEPAHEAVVECNQAHVADSIRIMSVSAT